MSPRCPLKANGPTQSIELHVPLFTGKAGLGDNKKGDIYISLRWSDVCCQITAQVGQGLLQTAPETQGYCLCHKAHSNLEQHSVL